jgi:amidase
MATNDDLWTLDATETAARIRTGRVTSRAVVESTLARLHAVNPRINAVVRTMDDEALAAADEADEAVRAGRPLGLLHGVPVTTKINTDQAGHPTDNGAVGLKDAIAAEDASVVANLRKAGAVFIGRTNAPVFSMRWFTGNELHGLTNNPWNDALTAGGSSGGAGAAVAAGIGAIGQGNDIGGSVRYPAYVNNIVGLRPTMGRISSYSVAALAGRTLGGALMAVQGPLTRTVRDCRLALEVMSARDERDYRWVGAPLRGPDLARPIRVAMVAEPEGEPVHASVSAAVRTAGRYLAAAGYQVEEVLPPDLERATQLWNLVSVPDVFASLKPRMGQYGDADAKQSLAYWMALDPEAANADLAATHLERDGLTTRWSLFMQDFPIVLMPSSGEPPLPQNLDIQGFEGTKRGFTANRFQLAIALLALPGLSVPVGGTASTPMGVQLVGPRWREDILLDAGEVIEANETWRWPDL